MRATTSNITETFVVLFIILSIIHIHIYNQLDNFDGLFVYVLANLLCRSTEDDHRLAASV